ESKQARFDLQGNAALSIFAEEHAHYQTEQKKRFLAAEEDLGTGSGLFLFSICL
ncbi:hypothetical protein ACJX0J_026052, partial [Zea mays]